MTPTTYKPQLATLVTSAPDDDGWLHEIKYDGYRIGCHIQGRQVTLISRSGKDWTSSFPEICEAALGLKVKEALLDGEIAMMLPDGRTSFQALQNAFKGGSRKDLVYFVFDLLSLNGVDVSHMPLETRKADLFRVLRLARITARIRYSEHVTGGGPGVLREACRLGLEGIVSKRRDEPYRPGRNTGWLKTKCIQRQEFVIGGFTDPEGMRQGIGALLVGFYDAAGRLAFAGKVGTGFTQEAALALRRRLDKLEQPDCPFMPRPLGLGRNVHWVRPELVGEVAFSQWTTDQKIRHSSFQGLREDKRPEEVVMEIPAPVRAAAHVPVTERQPGSEKPLATPASGAEVAGVRITHPDRILYPELGITKLDLARFYERIAKWILPHLNGRPLTLVRCPKGVTEECYYMRHSNVWAPAPLRRVRIPEKKKLGEYLIVESLPALVALVQMDILEIHTWNSSFDHLEQPNRIVFDVDPGSEVSWTEVVKAARLVKSVLEALGLESFVKTTGGAGLHVVIPLAPRLKWTECLAFSRSCAEVIVRHNPALYTTAFPKAGREQKILIDYLRNNRTNTSVAAFSTRARPNASVSVPLSWDELSATIRSDHYTVDTVPVRLAQLEKDPWHRYWKSRQQIGRAALKALAAM